MRTRPPFNLTVGLGALSVALAACSGAGSSAGPMSVPGGSGNSSSFRAAVPSALSASLTSQSYAYPDNSGQLPSLSRSTASNGVMSRLGIAGARLSTAVYSATVAGGDGSMRTDVAPGRVVYTITSQLRAPFQTLSGKTFAAGSKVTQTIDAATGDTLAVTMLGAAR